MKKILLTAAIAASVLCAQAGVWSDYFTVIYEGKELQSGDDAVCNEFWPDEDVVDGEIVELNVGSFMFAPIHVINKKAEAIQITAKLDFGTIPTAEQWAEGGVEVWGDEIALCYGGGGEDGSSMNCLDPENATAILPGNEYKTFEWELHKYYTPKIYTNWKLVFYPTEDPAAEFVLNLEVGTQFSGITGVESDNNAPKTYYNLQGVRVANPDKGLYIVRQGSKTSKVILK